MQFTYSICYPDKEDIEYRNTPISGKEVMDIARSYPWVAQLELSDSMDQEKVSYSPSLDFKCIDTGRSFSLTANYNEKKDLSFSLWYNRPKKVKVLFGLLGETERMKVDNVWGHSFIDAIKYLQYFVNGNYQLIEELYRR